MNNCQFDCLPVELIHHLLSYFSAHEIFYTFTNISSYFDAVLATYSYYQINFKSISKSNFNFVCQRIIPEQVISLILCNDEYTPGLVELFLSRFQINQFTHLQSLRLIDIGPDHWENIITKLVELKNLRSFFFISPTRISSWISDLSDDAVAQLDINLSNIYAPILPQLYRLRLCHGDFLKSIQFPQLRHLILERSSINLIEHLCSVAPQLKSLETKLLHDGSTKELFYSFTQLNRLVLQIQSSYVSMNDLERMISNLPCLKHLELIANCNNDVVDGQRWQTKVKYFVTFKFKFNLSARLNSRDLDSFRTRFWLEEKHWFVAYLSNCLFSVPYFNQMGMSENFKFPVYSTAPNNQIFYEYIDRLNLSEIPSNPHYYFTHVETLIVGLCIRLSTVEKFVNLNRVQHLILCVSTEKFPIRVLINEMPHLHRLAIKRGVNNFLKKVHCETIEQIRTLEISNFDVNTIDYNVEELSIVFPKVERLCVGHIRSTTQIFDFIDRFKHLSTASFQYTSWLANEEHTEQFRHKTRSVLNRIRRIQRFNYTYRFDRISVHIWI